MNSNRTTDEFFAMTAPPSEDHPLCFVDVHIYDYEPEPEDHEPIESHLEQEAALSDEHEQEPREEPECDDQIRRESHHNHKTYDAG